MRKKALCGLLIICLLISFFCFSSAAKTILLGDVNGDGKVSTTDSRKILEYAVENTNFTDEQLIVADVDGDSLITVNDARRALDFAINDTYKYIEIPDEEPSAKVICLAKGDRYILNLLEGYKNLTWESSNPLCVSVENGKISALNEGDATITARAGIRKESVNIHVVPAVDRQNYMKVLDVSKYQGLVDWQKVKADGISAAIIRIGYGDMLKNPEQIDSYFVTNLRNAEAAGIELGVYLFSYAENVEEALNEAQGVISVLKDYPAKFSYPVYFDFEYKTQGKKINTQMINAFCSAIEDAGWYAAYYTSASWARDYVDRSKINYDLWVAAYGADDGQPHPEALARWLNEEDYTMWQYTSASAVDGARGKVDMSFVYVNYPEIIMNGGYNGYTSGSSLGHPDDEGGVIVYPDEYTFIKDGAFLLKNLDDDPVTWLEAPAGMKETAVMFTSYNGKDYVKLQNGYYTLAENLKKENTKYTPTKVNEISMSVDEKNTVLKIDANRNISFTLDLGPESAELCLYNLGSLNFDLELPENPLFASAFKKQVSSSEVKFLLKYKKPHGIYGYTAHFDSHTLILSFRNHKKANLESDKPLKGIVISVDPGHSTGTGTVAVYKGETYYEYKMNYALSIRLKRELEKLGATVCLTHNNEREKDLNTIIKEVRALSPDLNISIQFNGGNPAYYGTCVYSCYEGGYLASKTILDSICAETGRDNNGVKAGYYNIIRFNDFPTIQLESLYMTSEIDMDWYLAEGNRDLYAKAVANGILKYFSE